MRGDHQSSSEAKGKALLRQEELPGYLKEKGEKPTKSGVWSYIEWFQLAVRVVQKENEIL